MCQVADGSPRPPLSSGAHLQNVRPALLVEDVVLEVFSVHVLGLLDLLRGHDLSWGRRGQGRGGRSEGRGLRKERG